MTTVGSKEQDYFVLAFELAFYIHVNKEVAFFVAEDAVDGLASTLGRQGENRKPSERLRGYLKWGERTRPVRTTVRLSEAQMLQWLVYKQSEPWERETERGEGLYLPTEEDMIVRYVEHLVFLTLRRGSFYVTLAVGALLHQFSRRETRLFYDILTQSDLARMKDTSYIGKQRLEMLEKVSQRFGHMIRTVMSPGDEKQFVTRPTTHWVIDLVKESLRRFAPWGATCVVRQGFEVTDIPGLYFSGDGSSDEDQVEMDRIHTLLDPECFAQFVDGLAKYVRSLPVDNQDKGCDYDSLNQRMAVPQFSNFQDGASRGDRFQAPSLKEEDYIRLQRTLAARARRRRNFTAQQLGIYIDDVLIESVEARRTNRAEFRIGPEAGVIEVRGRDAIGELTLAILVIDYDQIPIGGAFRDSVAHRGGPKVEIQLTPIRDADGKVEGAQVDASYAERTGSGLAGLVRRDRDVSESLESNYSWLLKAVTALALIVVVWILIWFQLRPSQQKMSPPEQAEQPSIEEEKPVSPVTQPAPPEPPPKVTAPLIARATWSKNPQAALSAIPVEPTRGEIKTIDLSRRQTRILLNLPLYDEEGRMYTHYRINLAAANEPLWQQTLAAPKVSLTGNAHILSLVLFSGQFSQRGAYDLQVEGRTKSGWQPLGHVLLNPVER